MTYVSPNCQSCHSASADESATEKEGIEIKINPETQNLNW
jgi:hypothetical protein